MFVSTFQSQLFMLKITDMEKRSNQVIYLVTHEYDEVYLKRNMGNI